MKTVGVIGGMSWQSSQLYYRLINQGVQKHLVAEAVAGAVNIPLLHIADATDEQL